jgi:PAN domain
MISKQDVAAASTSTVETTPPALYCSGGDILLAQAYTPQCGVSYIPENPDSNTKNTVDSYEACAELCDSSSFHCQVYSYLLTALEDNCYVFGVSSQVAIPYPDPDVDSGEVDD